MTTEPTSPDPESMHNTDQVYLRVHTFGAFGIAWVDPITNQATPLPAERLQGRGAAPALALLKALLGCPDRFASRDWLLEQLWPDSPSRSAKERLDDVASILRGLLRPEGSTAKILHFVYGSDGRGAGYRLDAYPQIWCDADAFMWYVEHATLLDRMGKDSTTCWERAYALAARGVYLPEHIYEDWARVRRDTLEGLLRDCVQRWSQVLRLAGHVDEAIRRLRMYWEERPTEEDALLLLLELLGERERFREAEACYAKAKAVLKEDGFEPDPRTQDMLECVRASQIRREPFAQTKAERVKPSSIFLASHHETMMQLQGVSKSTMQKARTLLQPGAQQISPSSSMARSLASSLLLFPSCMIQPEKSLEIPSLDCAAQFGIALAHMVTLIQQWYGMATFSQDLQHQLDHEMKKLDALKSYFPLETYMLSRRSILFALATLPTTLLLSRKQAHTLALELEEFLPHCAASITACWDLSKGSRLETIPSIIDSYLPTLIAVLKNAPFYCEVTADLIAQCYLLKSILAWHLESLAVAETYCIQATHYSIIAKNRNLRLTALNQHALIFYYAKQFQRALATSEEAYATLQQTSHEHIFPIMKGRVFMYLAAFQAQQGKDDAERTLELAQSAFALQTTTVEPIPAYVDCGEASLALWDGLTHYHLGIHNVAHAQCALTSLKVFGQIQSSTEIPERFRLECLTNRTLAAIRASEMEEAIDCLVAGKQGAHLLESKQRNAEIADAYQELTAHWPREEQVQKLHALLDISF